MMPKREVKKLTCGICGQAMFYLYQNEKGTVAVCAQRENDDVHCNDSMQDKTDPMSQPWFWFSAKETKKRTPE